MTVGEVLKIISKRTDIYMHEEFNSINFKKINTLDEDELKEFINKEVTEIDVDDETSINIYYKK